MVYHWQIGCMALRDMRKMTIVLHQLFRDLPWRCFEWTWIAVGATYVVRALKIIDIPQMPLVVQERTTDPETHAGAMHVLILTDKNLILQ